MLGGSQRGIPGDARVRTRAVLWTMLLSPHEAMRDNFTIYKRAEIPHIKMIVSNGTPTNSAIRHASSRRATKRERAAGAAFHSLNSSAQS